MNTFLYLFIGSRKFLAFWVVVALAVLRATILDAMPLDAVITMGCAYLAAEGTADVVTRWHIPNAEQDLEVDDELPEELDAGFE